MPSKRSDAPKRTPASGSARAAGGPADLATAGASTEATAILVPPPAQPAAPGPGPDDQLRTTGPVPVPNGRPAEPARRGRQPRRAKAAAAAPVAATAPAGAPAPATGRKAPRRGRRVHRIIRRIDLWSVLKLSLVLYTCIYASVLMATAGLWAFLNSAGLVAKFESFMKDVGFNNWEFHGPQMFKGVAAGGAVLVLFGSILTIVAVGLVNVVSELTGGIRVTVIEEAPVQVAPRRRPAANPTRAEWEAGQQAARRPPG